MPSAAIPFAPGQQSGSDELGGATAVAMNVVFEPTGAVRMRPAISTYSTFPTAALELDSSTTYAIPGVNGIYETEGGRVYTVGEDRIIRRVDTGDVNGYISTAYPAPSDERVSGPYRPTFAETEMLLVVSGGSYPQKVVLVAETSSRLSGSPPNASHVSAIASRLVMNDVTTDKSNIRYSGVANGNTSYAGMEQWSSGVGTAGFFRAEARPDSVIAIADNANEVFAWGSTSLQIFGSDPGFVFAPLATKEVGLAAASSVVKIDGSFMWLDDKRRFVISDGRSLDVVGNDIQQTLNDMTAVSDCFGYRVHWGPLEAVVWTFPTDGRTFCYQKGPKGGSWSQWSCSDSSTSNWSRFRVQSHCLGRNGVNYIGTTDGLVGSLAFGLAYDRSGSSQGETPIVSSVTTGFLDRGTPNRKQCKRVSFTMKRGTTTSSVAPVALISYRDDRGEWSSPISVNLGANADTYPVVELFSLGVYRTRQWKFTFSGSDIVLVGAVEEFEVLQH